MTIMKDCCEMKGFLTFQVLTMISRKDMSGEQIRIALKERRGQKPSPGTIYPVLKSLSESGFIEELKGNGKEKKYRLTHKGEKEVKVATKKFCEIFFDLKEAFAKHA